MTGRSFSRRVIVGGIGEPRAVAHQPPQSARELWCKAVQVIRPQLIDGDLYDERWRCDGLALLLTRCCVASSLRGRNCRGAEKKEGGSGAQ